MYYWLTVFSPRAVNFSLGSLSTNWKYPHSQNASWNDFRGPSVQALPHPLRVSLARARSLLLSLLPSVCYAGYSGMIFLPITNCVAYFESLHQLLPHAFKIMWCIISLQAHYISNQHNEPLRADKSCQNRPIIGYTRTDELLLSPLGLRALKKKGESLGCCLVFSPTLLSHSIRFLHALEQNKAHCTAKGFFIC